MLVTRIKPPAQPRLFFLNYSQDPLFFFPLGTKLSLNKADLTLFICQIIVLTGCWGNIPGNKEIIENPVLAWGMTHPDGWCVCTTSIALSPGFLRSQLVQELEHSLRMSLNFWKPCSAVEPCFNNLQRINTVACTFGTLFFVILKYLV